MSENYDVHRGLAVGAARVGAAYDGRSGRRRVPPRALYAGPALGGAAIRLRNVPPIAASTLQ